jgi:hypothetical protein
VIDADGAVVHELRGDGARARVPHHDLLAAGVADPLMRVIVRRNIAGAYRGLKELLESRSGT